ncbi:hypothetical protein [Agromyces archimandritae]|uniref:Polysaccharide biosynthesis protein n=1 Tax=Agromyces archimandritae TaxID=2781962 RepID=A0A975IP47_9MICO|nr:hypothetical protein [Agromyces archimandritae]QTX05272.1 hypothetical protein G127AT_03315 [Agromyces archimandritae]
MNRLKTLFRSGSIVILAATVVGGLAGYLANAIVGANITAVEYSSFGVFWSALYFIIAVISGVQQEVTRATRPKQDHSSGGALARRFAVIGAVATGAIVFVSGFWWAPIVFPSSDVWAVVAPIALGCSAYFVVAVLSGTLYGLTLWPAIGAMIVVDGVLRLAAIGTVLIGGWGETALYWAVVLPFPLTPSILWWVFRSRVVGRSMLDVGAAELTWNSLRTTTAAVAIGVLVSGFPVVLALVRPSAPAEELGTVIFGINLVRAPLVTIVLSLQSYLVIRFRSEPGRSGRTAAMLIGIIIGAALVFAGVAVLVAEWLLPILWADYALSGGFIAALAGSGGMLGLLCVSGPLALAKSRHGAYSLGWVAAAAVAVIALMSPLPLVTAIVVALSAGPAIGVAIHLIGARYSH